MATKLVKTVIYLNGSESYITFQSHGLVKSGDKLKSFYLPCYIAYGHQTWQAGDMLREAFTHNVTPPFVPMVF